MKSIKKLLAVSALLGCTGAAQAAFHLMKIVEVFPGSVLAPNAQYVVLQMYAGSQNFVSAHPLTVYNASGAVIATFTFSANVANGTNQDKILIATPEAVALFGFTSADLAMTPVLPLDAGAVCFDDTVDCVGWGSAFITPSPFGAPFNPTSMPLIAPGGLIRSKAMKRRLDIAGGTTTLENADDTNNSANDFVFGTPAPRNNARVNGVIPPSNCPNMIIEGLEQCDDGNANNGDGCSSLCELEPVPERVFQNGFE